MDHCDVSGFTMFQQEKGHIKSHSSASRGPFVEDLGLVAIGCYQPNGSSSDASNVDNVRPSSWTV